MCGDVMWCAVMWCAGGAYTNPVRAAHTDGEVEQLTLSTIALCVAVCVVAAALWPNSEYCPTAPSLVQSESGWLRGRNGDLLSTRAAHHPLSPSRAWNKWISLLRLRRL